MSKSFAEWAATLTWRCDICHKERPDSAISVHKVDLFPDHPGVGVRNVKYCNDNSACIQGAKEWKEPGR